MMVGVRFSHKVCFGNHRATLYTVPPLSFEPDLGLDGRRYGLQIVRVSQPEEVGSGDKPPLRRN
jgi:hypothetical protein